MLIDVMADGKKIIVNSLRKHRRLMGFSQEEVKKRLNLKSTSMISRWERGITMPSGDNLLKLSVLYKALVNELYYELSKEYQLVLFPEEKNGPMFVKKRNPNVRDRGP